MNKDRVTEREFLEELTDLVSYALEKDDKNVLARAYGRIEEQLNAVKYSDRLKTQISCMVESTLASRYR